MSSTKVVSFRLPTKDYNELLSIAKNAKMTLSDYVLHLVYSGGREVVTEADERVEHLKGAQDELHKNTAVLRAQLEQANHTIAFLQKEVEQQRKDMKARHNAVMEEILDYFEEADDNSVFSSYKKQKEYLENNVW